MLLEKPALFIILARIDIFVTRRKTFSSITEFSVLCSAKIEMSLTKKLHPYTFCASP